MTRTVLITGDSRGIGLAIATGLSTQGYHVVIGARDPEAGRKAAAKINATAVQLDVADSKSIDQCVQEVGHIDILVNNAGVLHTDPLLDNPHHLDESIAVMLRGPFHLIHAVVPSMRERQWGRAARYTIWLGSFVLAGTGLPS